ncbi:hypothetical protein DB30_06419 [Enhygromyxa salina]|uniref:Uncharacterized protein n=1 Tax=Enhygromyxa salina TaxID=215803 RepID=A0A0C1ZUI8_9BACT|nr:hypothetical protein DB30_06419 [Enhygromyxa salina]
MTGVLVDGIDSAVDERASARGAEVTALIKERAETLRPWSG